MLPYITVGNRLIPMYGVCMALGILISSYIAFIRIKRVNGDCNSLIIIVSCAVGCGLIGSKLLYIVVSYGVGNVMAKIQDGDFRFLWEGGLVFYGGLIGGIIGTLFGVWLTSEDLAVYCDAIVPCIALGHALGRLGCFFAGCCYGISYTGFYSMIFVKMGINLSTFPIQLVEMMVNIGIFIYLILYTRKEHTSYHVLYRYLILYAVFRFVLEFMRGDQIRGISKGLSTSQWISIGMLIISILLMLPGIIKKGGYNRIRFTNL